MSGILPGGALGAVGFVRSIVTSITVPSLRYMVWPVQAPSGQPVQTTTNTSGTQPTQQTELTGLSGYIPIIEEHRDELTVTQHPVEQGAAITDHAYKNPAMLSLRIGWSTSMPDLNPLSLGNLTGISALNALSLPTLAGFWSTPSDEAINNIYNTLLSLQINRNLITVATARRLYKNTVLQGLSITTDEKSEHSLIVSCSLQEVILVNTQVIQNAGVSPTASTSPETLTPPAPQGGKNLTPITPPATTTIGPGHPA